MGHSKAGSQPHTAGAAADALVYRDARLLAGQLAAGSLSAREVMTAFLQRIEACNPIVNAICTLLPAEQALALADAADRQRLAGAATGPLHGLPIAVKDLAATRGMRTTMGSPIFADNIPEQDSLLVQRLRAAGALVIGKTNTPEVGTGSHTFNPLFGITRNPWDTGKSAGGSSGGAAAALACGMLPLADGSDMGGSLRNPAAFCNVVGFRPSMGRVPHWPNAMAWQSRLGVEGPMARSVEDCALLLSVLAGPDDSVCVDTDNKSVRIGTEPGNTLQLADETVSRFHVEITGTRQGIRVRDLDSTNGTWLAGNVRVGEAVVPAGSVLYIGRTQVRIDALAGSSTPELSDRDRFGDMIGSSPEMRALWLESDADDGAAV